MAPEGFSMDDANRAMAAVSLSCRAAAVVRGCDCRLFALLVVGGEISSSPHVRHMPSGWEDISSSHAGQNIVAFFTLL